MSRIGFGWSTSLICINALRFYAVLAFLVVAYLLVVEMVKRLFYRHMNAARGTERPARA